MDIKTFKNFKNEMSLELVPSNTIINFTKQTSFRAINLYPNSKNPIERWSLPKYQIKLYPYKQISCDKYEFHESYNKNVGILTGKINNIMVVDIDAYKMDQENILLKEYSNYLDIDTYIVKTPSGGYHLYFEYDEDLKQTASNIHIDIRNNGGYIVMEGSYFNNNQYLCYKDKQITAIPKDFKDFLMKYIYKPKIRKEKYQNKILNNEIEKQTIKNTISINKKTKSYIIKALEENKQNKKFFETYEDFLYFTNAMKHLNAKKEWDEFNICHDKYDFEKNIKIWNTIYMDSKYNNITWLLKKLSVSVYDVFKPTLENTKKETELINKQKLGGEERDFFKLNKNYIVKSDTGTGKTTSFIDFIKCNKTLNFISIVSRKSLGQEQYKQISCNGIDCKFYANETEKNINQGDNIIVQLDSIYKLSQIKDLGNYIIFLDEVNSIVEYLISSDTLKKNRTSIFNNLIYVINECGNFIGTDADISDIVFKFLDATNRNKYNYIVNEFKHNKGVKAYEIETYNEFITKLSKEDKFLVCTDSKSMANLIKLDLTKINKDNNKIIVITSDIDEYINFDENDKIIYSPKIIYGIDSTMQRPVYCYYKEHTINPRNMVQQVARCRNITELNFLFTGKTYNHNDDCYDEINEMIIEENMYSSSCFEVRTMELKQRKNYQDLITMYEYNKIAYNTNKFAHFINLLNKRGFEIQTNRFKKHHETEDENEKMKKLMGELKKDTYTSFDIDANYKYQKVHSILKINKDDLLLFKQSILMAKKLEDLPTHVTKTLDLYINDFKLYNHFNICNFMNKSNEDIMKDLDKNNDFNINKIKSSSYQLVFLRKLKKLTNNEDIYTINSNNINLDNGIYHVDHNIENKESRINKINEEINKEYKLIFRTKKENIDFNNNYECNKTQAHIYKLLFGEDICKSNKIRDGKKTVYEYTINEDEIDFHKHILEYRKPSNNIEFIDDNIIKPSNKDEKDYINIDKAEVINIDKKEMNKIKNKKIREFKKINKQKQNEIIVDF